MNILLVAESFGFGPAGSLMACKEQLAHKSHNWRYAGATFSQSLIVPEEFEEVILLPNDFDMSSKALKRSVDWADIIISGTEFRVFEIVKDHRKKVIVYDPLAWFWESAQNFSYPNVYYVCPNFFGLDKEKMSFRYGEKFFLIRPFQPEIRESRDGSRKGGLLINLCGLYNPHCVLDDYYVLILDAIEQILKKTKWDHVTVTGNSHLHHRLLKRYTRFQLDSKNHAEMVRCIRNSDLLLTSPGLNSSLEAMSLGTPVGFLPPQNNSQAAQLEIFQKHNLSPVLMDWDNISGRIWTWKGKQPCDAIRELFSAMKFSQHDPESTERLSAKLSTMLSMTSHEWQEIKKRQSKSFEELCGDLRDFKSVFEQIENN